MSTDMVTLSTDKGSFNQLATAMGMTADMDTKKTKSNLARLKIDHSGIDGETEIKGKKKTIKVVDPGMYSLELPDGDKIYQEDRRERFRDLDLQLPVTDTQLQAEWIVWKRYLPNHWQEIESSETAPSALGQQLWNHIQDRFRSI